MKVLLMELVQWSLYLAYLVAAMDRIEEGFNCTQHFCCLEMKPLSRIKQYFLNILPIFQESETACLMIGLGHVAVMLKMETGYRMFVLVCRLQSKLPCLMWRYVFPCFFSKQRYLPFFSLMKLFLLVCFTRRLGGYREKTHN